MAVDLTSPKHVSNPSIMTNRAAIDVSFDQNFDDIYNRRFKKYCLLLAKERELLKRLGKVRMLKHYNVQNEETDPNDEDVLYSGNHGRFQRKQPLKYPPNISPLPTLSEYRRISASVDNVGYEDKDYGRRSCSNLYYRDNSRNRKLHHAKSFDDVAFAEDYFREDDDNDLSAVMSELSTTSPESRRQKPFTRKSSSPSVESLQHPRQNEHQLNRNRNESGLVDDAYWQTRISGRKCKSLKEMNHLLPPHKARLTSFKRLSTSYEEIDQQLSNDDFSEKPPANHPRLLQPRRSAPHYLDAGNETEFLARLPHSKSYDGTSFKLANGGSKSQMESEKFDSRNIPRMINHIFDSAVNDDVEFTLQKRERNSLITSSYRDLSDRNVRDVKKFAKKLRSWSPALERRLAEAKQRQSKRDEVLKSLDHDFDKAKEIMEKYKSSENLYRSEENLTAHEQIKYLPRTNLAKPKDVTIKRRSWTFFE